MSAVALAVISAAIWAFGLSAGPAQAAGSNRPKITALTLSPSPVGGSGGTEHLHATVKHAASCRISVTPHLSGFPKTHSCSSGHLSTNFHIGANTAAASRHFVVSVKATKAGHHATKQVHLTQLGVAPSGSSLSASPLNLSASGGVTTLTATVSHAGTCSLSASPAVAGLPAAVACGGSSYSQHVTLPANTSTTAAQSYTFTLELTGPGGSTTLSTHPVVTVAAAAAPGGGTPGGPPPGGGTPGGPPPGGGTPGGPPGGGGPQPITSLSSAAIPVPAGANTGANDDSQLKAVSCPAAGDCVAVGDYDATYNSTGDPYIGLIETYNGTTWTPTQAPLPSNAYTTYPAVDLYSVSCSSATACVAVGQFDAEVGGAQVGLEPYIAVLSNGTWTAVTVSTPSPSTAPGGNLNQVSCASDGTCVAVGYYSPPGEESALIEQLGTGGSWAAISPQLPGNADSSSQHNYLNGVSCTGSNACTAVGGYVSGGNEYGLGVVLSGATWSPAELQPTGDLGHDGAVSCAGTYCLATGDYNTNVSVIQATSNGSWTGEVATPLPTTNTGSAELYGVDCASSASCVGVGTYYSTGSVTEGLIDYGSGTAYTAQEAPLPSNENTSNPIGDLQEISCGSVGACVAAGSYQDNSDDGQGLLETESDGGGTPSWVATSPQTPGSGTFLGLYGISCFGTYGCVAVGDYENTAGGVTGEIVLTPG